MSLLPHSKSEPVDSLSFQVGRGSFRMRVFPHGRVHEQDDRVSVFIRCTGIVSEREAPVGADSAEAAVDDSGKDEKTAAPRRVRGRYTDGQGPLTSRPHATSSSSSSSSSSSRARSHQPSLSVRYRFRFVHPSGDRGLDETIPTPLDAPYAYNFSVDDEHEGAFVTHQSLHGRHIISGDVLILQVDMEVMQGVRSEYVFSHGLPVRVEGSEEEEKDVERALGRQFLRAWREGRECDVWIRVKGAETAGTVAGGGGGGVDDDEDDEEKDDEEEQSVQSEEADASVPARSHLLKKQRTSLTSQRSIAQSANLIPAHKFVLSSRSSVFAVMLSHDMRERKESVIEIDDIDRDTVLRLLYFLYAGMLPTTAALTALATPSSSRPSFSSSLSSRSYPSLPSTSLLPPSILPTPITRWDESVKLFHASHKYALPQLSELSAWSIVRHLSDDTVLPTLQLSECYRDQAGAGTLFDAGKEWMCRRFEQVIRKTCDVQQAGDGSTTMEVVAVREEAKEREKKERTDSDELVDGCTVHVFADGPEDENKALASLSLSASSSSSNPRVSGPIALATVVNARWQGQTFALCLILSVLEARAVEQVTLPGACLRSGLTVMKAGAVLPLRYGNLRLAGNRKSLVTSSAPPASSTDVLSSSLASISIPRSDVSPSSVAPLVASLAVSEGGEGETVNKVQQAGTVMREGGGKKRGREDVAPLRAADVSRLPARSSRLE